MRITITVLAAVLVLGAACDDNPDERTLLSGPRLLAVRSTPPALRGLDGTVNLSALAIDGDGLTLPGSEVQYRACSPWKFLVDPGSDCPQGEALNLGDNSLTVQALLDFYPPPVPVGAVGGADDDGPRCDLRAVFEVPVVAQIQVGEASLVTVKRIPIYFNEVIRRNPKIASIEVEAIGEEQYALTIDIDANSLDLECRDDAEVLEAVRIYFYSTSGSFEESSVDIVPAADGSLEAGKASWTSSGKPATLFAVAIDNDGGVGWQVLSL